MKSALVGNQVPPEFNPLVNALDDLKDGHRLLWLLLPPPPLLPLPPSLLPSSPHSPSPSSHFTRD